MVPLSISLTTRVTKKTKIGLKTRSRLLLGWPAPWVFQYYPTQSELFVPFVQKFGVCYFYNGSAQAENTTLAAKFETYYSTKFHAHLGKSQAVQKLLIR